MPPKAADWKPVPGNPVLDINHQFRPPSPDLLLFETELEARIYPPPPPGRAAPATPPRPRNDDVAKSALRYLPIHALELKALLDDEFVPPPAHLLEFYLELICKTQNSRTNNHNGISEFGVSRAEDLRVAEVRKNGRGNLPYGAQPPPRIPCYMYQTLRFTERLLNRAEKKSNEWGYVKAAQMWKDIYPFLGNKGFSEGFFDVEHIFLPLHENQHTSLIVISPIQRSVEYLSSRREYLEEYDLFYKVFQYLAFELGDRFILSEWSYRDAGSPQEDQRYPKRINSEEEESGDEGSEEEGNEEEEEEEADEEFINQSTVYAMTNAFNVAFGLGTGRNLYNSADIAIRCRRIAFELHTGKLDFGTPPIPIMQQDLYLGLRYKQPQEAPGQAYLGPKTVDAAWTPIPGSKRNYRGMTQLGPGTMSWIRDEAGYEPRTEFNDVNSIKQLRKELKNLGLNHKIEFDAGMDEDAQRTELRAMLHVELDRRAVVKRRKTLGFS